MILAGVTISQVVGDNGVLTKAGEAAEETKKSEVITEVELAWSAMLSAYYEEAYTNQRSVDKATFFSVAAINKELQSGTISDYTGYNEDGDTEFTYTSKSSGETYRMLISSAGKASITAYNGVVLANTNVDGTDASGSEVGGDEEEPVQVTITYNVNGGNLEGGVSTTKQVNSGSQVGTLPEATKSGSTFVGWYTEQEGGAEVTETTTFAEDKTIYAHWGLVASDLKNNTDCLGKLVNYDVTYSDAATFYGEGETRGLWEILYVDDNYVYIITRGSLANDFLSVSGYNGTSDFTSTNLSTKFKAVADGWFNKTYDPDETDEANKLKYSSSYNNMLATEYLLDSTNWSDYSKTNYSRWVIGGPTFELFVAAYNKYYPSNTVSLSTPSEGSYGYDNPLSSSCSVPNGTFLNHGSSSYWYWLACPSSSINNTGNGVRYVDGGYAYVDISTFAYSFGFRPVVCLNSNVVLTWNSTTNMYDLSLN